MLHRYSNYAQKQFSDDVGVITIPKDIDSTINADNLQNDTLTKVDDSLEKSEFNCLKMVLS